MNPRISRSIASRRSASILRRSMEKGDATRDHVPGCSGSSARSRRCRAGIRRIAGAIATTSLHDGRRHLRRPGAPIGVGPAEGASMPVTTQSYQRRPSTPVTTPIVLAASSTGPCSMWASKYTAERVLARLLGAVIADPLELLLDRLAVVSFAAYAWSSENARETARAHHDGTNREPSSFVQKMTSIGASVSTLWSQACE